MRFEILARREISDSLIGEILDLYSRSFERWPRFDPRIPLADHLTWKMESPGGRWSAVVGWSGSRLVVARTVVSHGVRVHGSSRSILDLPDVAVDPAYRGRGISTALSAYSDVRVEPFSDLQLDDSTHPRIAGRSRRAHARPLGNPIRALHLPFDARRFGRDLIGHRRSPRALSLLVALSAAAAAARLRARRRGRASQRRLTLHTAAHLDARADALFERAAAPFDLIFESGRERLEWRYCDRRAGPFVVRIAEDEEGELIGYAVVRHAAPAGILADLLALPERLDAVEALAHDAVALLGAGGAAGVSTWLPNRHPYRSVLRRVGFVAAPRPIPIRHRSQRLPPEELAFLDRRDARIHFVIGNTDLV